MTGRIVIGIAWAKEELSRELRETDRKLAEGDAAEDIAQAGDELKEILDWL
ncbi:hypothetical protein [Numidum massiliense]|uniref:hypothetical protein n=1 Tax=Numidum massiliense TaxID=1522315 RepID=UPI0012F9CE6A|nr:hypothetical protein [Numidum massiliense]